MNVRRGFKNVKIPWAATRCGARATTTERTLTQWVIVVIINSRRNGKAMRLLSGCSQHMSNGCYRAKRQERSGRAAGWPAALWLNNSDGGQDKRRLWFRDKRGINLAKKVQIPTEYNTCWVLCVRILQLQSENNWSRHNSPVSDVSLIFTTHGERVLIVFANYIIILKVLYKWS